MRKLGRFLIPSLFLAVLALLPGCVLVAAGVGVAGVAYLNGDLEAMIDATPQQVVKAAESALKEMEVNVTAADASGIDGKVVGRTALDKKVEVTVKRETDTQSKLWIRIDTFGDEALSRQILEKIRTKL